MQPYRGKRARGINEKTQVSSCLVCESLVLVDGPQVIKMLLQDIFFFYASRDLATNICPHTKTGGAREKAVEMLPKDFSSCLICDALVLPSPSCLIADGVQVVAMLLQDVFLDGDLATNICLHVKAVSVSEKTRRVYRYSSMSPSATAWYSKMFFWTPIWPPTSAPY